MMPLDSHEQLQTTQEGVVEPRSAEEPVAVAIDIGSSSVRSMAFDRRAREVAGATAQESYELDTRLEGQVTVDPDLLLDTVGRCLDATHRAIEEANLAVGAVGFSSFWHSLLGLDRHGNPLTPVFHLADNRSATVVDTLRESHDEAAWQRITGTVFHSSYWLAKLIWLRETDPEAFAATSHWSSAADYISGRLIGTGSTSLCMASGTGMCEVRTGRWSSELIELSGAAAGTFPTIVDRRTLAFLLSDQTRRWPRLAQAPWFPALGDGACANVGSGAIDRRRIALTLGTTGAMRVLDRAPTGSDISTYSGLWTYRLDGETVVHGAAITNGGIWIEFVRETLRDDDGELLAAALDVEPGAHGLTVLPFLAGERAPIWNDRARAVIAGLSPGTSREEIARASLEAIAHRLALVYVDTSRAADPKHEIIANGAALLRSSGLQQLVADSLEHAIVTLPPSLEASARGAAICALQAAGCIESLAAVDDLATGAPEVVPDAAASAIYRAERERHEALRRLLYPDSSSWDRC